MIDELKVMELLAELSNLAHANSVTTVGKETKLSGFYIDIYQKVHRCLNDEIKKKIPSMVLPYNNINRDFLLSFITDDSKIAFCKKLRWWEIWKA